MSSLKDRLQSGLIGKDETGSASSYESIQTDAQNSLRKEQREELQATIANIEADLKGLLPKVQEPLPDAELHAAGINPQREKDATHGRNSAIREMSAAIERYTSGTITN